MALPASRSSPEPAPSATEEGALGVRLLPLSISGIKFEGFSLCGSDALETRESGAM